MLARQWEGNKRLLVNLQYRTGMDCGQAMRVKVWVGNLGSEVYLNASQNYQQLRGLRNVCLYYTY